MEGEDFPLPRLSENIKILTAPISDGEPQWILHHPITNSYFQIDWISYECLSRFHLYKTAHALKAAVMTETTLIIEDDDIRNITLFLHRHNLLVQGKNSAVPFVAPKKIGWIEKILKSYLYFTIPLFRPQNFLQKTFPSIDILFHHYTVKAFLLFLFAMIALTIPRVEEFFTTFSDVFSFEGILQIGFVFFCIKIVHEFAHAYAAIKYGVHVPHMGIAFLVMYPVLYTETTASWEISSRSARRNIALAGIIAELSLAGVFLALWHLFPAGSLAQTICFLVVSVAIVGSVLVNLNPLMRFDGYYILSETLGIDNLQQKACAFARWNLRRILFNMDREKPEFVTLKKERVLIWFGTALIIYRFFLYMGIAFFVYHAFFQPLGLILMIIELVAFIGLPFLDEIKDWWRMRHDIFRNSRVYILIGTLCALIILGLLPLSSSVSLPAVLHARQQEFFSPVPALITSLSVHSAQTVEKDAVLAELSSPVLERDLRLAALRLDQLELMFNRSGIIQDVNQGQTTITKDMVEKARLVLEGYKKQKEKLKITAPFHGSIVDLDPLLHSGQDISAYAPLFTLINRNDISVSAYLTENQRDRIKVGDKAVFYSGNEFSKKAVFVVEFISDVSTSNVLWQELTSPYGGPIAADRDIHGARGAVISRQSLYPVTFKPADKNQMDYKPNNAQVGYLVVSAQRKSFLYSKINNLYKFLRNEAAQY